MRAPLAATKRSNRATPSARRASSDAKHQRTKPSPSGPNALPGARPRPRFAHQPLAEREAVGRGRRRGRTRTSRRPAARRRCPAASRSAPHEMVARAREALASARDRGLALRDRGDARVLHERRRARRVVLDELAEIGHQRARRDDPAEPPAGHQPRLREAVGAITRSSASARSRNDGAACASSR